MPTDSRAAFHRSAAAILAAVLLMALAWTGWRVVQQVRLAPSTVSPATIAASKTLHGDAATRQRATDLASGPRWAERSEEHTSELQSHLNLVCRLLLEKKKKKKVKDVAAK